MCQGIEPTALCGLILVVVWIVNIVIFIPEMFWDHVFEKRQGNNISRRPPIILMKSWGCLYADIPCV